MSATERRIDILRQLARAPDGLRIGEIRGPLSMQAYGDYLRALHREHLVDTVPVCERPGRTSNRPVSRYVINAAGRAWLERQTA